MQRFFNVKTGGSHSNNSNLKGHSRY